MHELSNEIYHFYTVGTVYYGYLGINHNCPDHHFLYVTVCERKPA